nr:BTAD domain-containing putative transcriptional regulator [Streptomyces sp. SID13031]
MQAYVSRLRSALGAEYRDRLDRTATGYRLTVDELDVLRFAELIESARAARPDVARRQLTEALALWRGEPYAELPDELAHADRSRLQELHEVAAEELVSARLDDGDAAGAVAQLEQLVREQPLRERRWALLVLGLYRCNRQGDALATLRKVRDLLADQLGVDPGPELQMLEQQVLAQDPRLRLATLATPMTPVPRPLTSFVGRAADLAQLADRLTRQRLVTLIGPGGVGKTRLTVEYVSTLPPTDELWFAKLADVSDPAAVPTAVADAVGLVARDGDPTALLIRTIGTRPALLVLDNCEHLVAAAGSLVASLIQGCPRLRILATSREPLGVEGELTLPVDPLPWATDGDAAVGLLVDRVQAVRPGWLPSATELMDARRVAAALDGLPLAIELAAARARVLGLGEIADRLDDRFALLGAVPRGSVARHETLAAAIGWSVDLLDPADRGLLLRLWAFEGGFTLEAAESLGVRGTAVEVLESLSALVTRSVVVADTTAEPTRYLLLESIRAYCRKIDPDPDGTLKLQARWVHLLTEHCAVAIREHRGGWFIRRMNRELPNVRAGFAHDLARDPAAALTTAVGLGVYLYRSVHHGEAIRMLRAALDAAPDGPAIDRGRALNSLTALTYFSGDLRGVDELVDTVVELLPAASTESPRDYAELCLFLAVGCAVGGRTELTADIAGRVETISTDHGLTGLVSSARSVYGVALLKAAHQAGDEEAILVQADLIEQTGRGFMRAWANLAVAETFLLHPRAVSPERAMERVRVSLAKFLEHEDYPYALNVLRIGALAMMRVGRSPEDAARLLAAVRTHAELLGLRTRGLVNPAEPWVEDAFEGIAVPAGVELSWSEMVALFLGD